MAPQPKYPGIPTPSPEPVAVVRSLQALKEGLEIGQRLRGDPMDSFVRLRELVNLGVVGDYGGTPSAPPVPPPVVIPPAPPVSKGAAFVSSLGALVAASVNKVSVSIPVAGVITKVRVLTEGGTGSCVLDIWKDGYANYPPVVGDSITAAAKPTISSGTKYEDTALVGWNKALAAGDVLRFSLDSVATFTAVFIYLDIQPST